MANNYGSFEGTMDANGILGGEIQFNGAGGKVKDVQVNDVSVVDANGIAKIDLTDYAKTEDIPADLADLQDDETHRLVTDAEKTEWSGKADTSDIPTDLADLSDDATHRLVTDTEKSTWDNKADVSDIPTVNNPTITIQKNGQNIDTFTLNQTANKVIDISVPTKTSDLQNDSSFITNTVNNLANYYLKSQTYTQAEVDALIDAAVNGRFRKVTVLPATGEPNIIYLVPKATPETSNACDEYIWQDNAWELIGSTDIDLSGYVTDEDLGIALADYLTISAFNTAIANYYTKTEVGNLLDGKVDKINGKGLSTNDYDNTAKGIVDGVTNALAGKVDKVNGKGLSTEDYTTTEKNKLAGISTNAKKVEASTTNGNIKIDDTETQVYDDSEIQDKIDETTTSISGNPISIPNLKSNQLAVNPIITFEPIQAGSGTPSPSNIRAISGYDKIEVLSCGKNLFDKSEVVLGGLDTTTGEETSSTTTYRSGWIRVKASTTYVLSGFANVIRPYYYGQGGAFIERDSSTTASTFTTPSGCAYVRFQIASATWTGTSNPQLEEAQTATTYVPYHKTTDISESLGQTVYLGELDVRSGKFKVLGAIKDMGDMTWSYDSGYSRFLTSDLSSVIEKPAAARTQRLWFSCYECVTDGRSMSEVTNGQAYSGATGAVYAHDDRYTDGTVFKTAVAGQKIVYPLDTPIEIQLTPHEISLLKDYAYVSTNGTNISLDYHNGELASLADVVQLNETLERKVLRTEGHAYSTSEQIVGTWIDGTPIYEKTIFVSSITANDNWQEIANLSLNILIDFECLCLKTGSGWSGRETSTRGDKNCPQIYGSSSTGKIYYALISGTDINQMYVTARYTKASS